ncbi:hypothetical protein D3C71_1808700 [compost metagenome]
MHKPAFTFARLPRQPHHKGAILTRTQLRQHLLHFGNIIKFMHAVGSGTQFPRGLRATQQ